MPRKVDNKVGEGKALVFLLKPSEEPKNISPCLLKIQKHFPRAAVDRTPSRNRNFLKIQKIPNKKDDRPSRYFESVWETKNQHKSTPTQTERVQLAIEISPKSTCGAVPPRKTSQATADPAEWTLR